MTASDIGNLLAPINALLNATSAVLIFIGYWAIKRRRIDTHRRAMQGALVASLIFLICYLARFSLTGTHRFPQVGLVRSIYLVILSTHTLLAAIALPLVLVTFVRARRAEFERHRRLARITFPIWAYVSVTGIVVYVMLYHVAPLLAPAAHAP
jgi:putative membrane protein